MLSRLATLFSSVFAGFRALSLTGKVRLALAALGVFEVSHLVFAEKPWHVEVPEGRKPGLDDHVAVYGWMATLINLVATALLFATAPWWTRPLGARPVAGSGPTPRWFWPVVGAAVVITAAFAWPRLDDSFWDDEEYNMRYAILGKYQTGEDGSVRLRRLDWMATFFDYREPNNHVLHSLLARTSFEIWNAVTRPAGRPFAEWPLRIPAFLFGLAGIATAAWFAREFVGPRAGVLTAWLLALHPWFQRYASEARGYSLALCLLPVAFVLWRRCLADGRARWWLGYAVTQWAAIYAYPGVLLVLAALNLLAVPILFFHPAVARPVSVPVGRWFAANTFSVMAVLQLMLPLYPQAKAYFAYETARNFSLGWPWVQSTLAFLAAGVPLAGETADHPSLQGIFSAAPEMLVVFALVLTTLAALGLARFLKLGAFSAAVALAIVLPPVLTFGISVSRRHLIYASYVIYALPGLTVFVAAAIDHFAARFGTWRGGRIITPVWLALCLGGFFLVTHSTRLWLAGNPLQPLKDSVQLSRGTLDPFSPENAGTLTASFSIPPYLYDPRSERLESADQMIDLLRRADAEGKPLVVNIGMPWAARAYSPKMWAMFNDPRLFTPPVRLTGFDSGLDRMVATYRPGAAAQVDFSALSGPDR